MCYVLWYKYEMVSLGCEGIIYIYNAEPLIMPVTQQTLNKH